MIKMENEKWKSTKKGTLEEHITFDALLLDGSKLTVKKVEEGSSSAEYSLYSIPDFLVLEAYSRDFLRPWPFLTLSLSPILIACHD